MQPLQYVAAGVVEPALGAAAAATLGRWLVGVAVFAAFWRFSVEVALPNNHSASVCVASPGHVMGHCEVKSRVCTVQQFFCSLHWVLRPGWAGGWWGLWFLPLSAIFS